MLRRRPAAVKLKGHVSCNPGLEQSYGPGIANG